MRPVGRCFDQNVQDVRSLVAEESLQVYLALLGVWRAQGYLLIKAAGPQQRWIEKAGLASRGDD